MLIFVHIIDLEYNSIFDGYVELPVPPHVEIMRDVVMATL